MMLDKILKMKCGHFGSLHKNKKLRIDLNKKDDLIIRIYNRVDCSVIVGHIFNANNEQVKTATIMVNSNSTVKSAVNLLAEKLM